MNTGQVSMYINIILWLYKRETRSCGIKLPKYLIFVLCEKKIKKYSIRSRQKDGKITHKKSDFS